MEDDANMTASSVQIKILVVVDAEYIVTHYPKQSGPDWNNPVPVDKRSYYLFADDPRGVISGQGTANLVLRAMVGDNVRVTGITFDDNCDDAVIVYGISKLSGDDIFTQFVMNVVTRKGAVSPDPNSPSRNGLPPLHNPKNFCFLSGTVVRAGSECMMIKFGLYTLDQDGQTQSLYGYFCGDATIKVG